MPIAAYDPTNLNRLIGLAESVRDHRRQHPANKSDEMYYGIIADYYKTLRDAHELGKKRVYYSTQLPAEIFHAMDIAPAIYEPLAMAFSTLGNSYEDALASAKSFGIAVETCSVYRLFIGAALNGWLPKPDALVWSSMFCDGASGSSEILRRAWDIPGFYLDRCFNSNEREAAYFVDELKGLIRFLEGVTGRKMDYDRLSEYVARTREVMLLERELEELRTGIPSPVRNRTGSLAQAVSLYMLGTQQVVDYFRQLLAEAKEHARQGVGIAKEEKYRLLLVNGAPPYDWKIIDWLETAHNAAIVHEPLLCYWGPGDFDPAKPLEALAHKTFCMPQWVLWGPMQSLADQVVRAAKEYKADGVLTFTHVGCKQVPQCDRLLKDRLADETGLPYFVVETDLADPSFVSKQEMRDKIDVFFEMIEERRKGTR